MGADLKSCATNYCTDSCQLLHKGGGGGGGVGWELGSGGGDIRAWEILFN